MRFASPALLAGLVLVAACGSADPNPSGNPSTDGPVKATINGQAWASSASTSAIRSANGLYSITALSLTGDYSLIFSLYNIGATGTYPLGTGPQLFGGNVVVSKVGASGWSTPLTGNAGQIVISTLTATRMTGTFSFTANPLTGTGNLAVTNGTFDIPVSGTAAFGPIADNIGGRYTGTISGTAFGIGSMSAILTTGASPTLTIAASNVERNIVLSLTNMTGAGTYALSAASPVRTLQITGSPTSQTATWNSQGTGGSGTVIITSVTASRVVGSYTATLVPLAGGATGNLTVTANFDVSR